MANTMANTVAVNLWTARVIPFLLAGMVGYATYVVIGPLTVIYLLGQQRNTAAAIPILIIYFLLLIFMAASFFRLVYITFADPPYIPLGPAAIRDQAKRRERRSNNVELRDGIGSGEYNAGNVESADSNSPGLEMFYTKDIFVSEMDGKPKWCTHCGNWKPDRAHHCSTSGRCISRMDHFCPWVGGPIGENNFKFFIQFTGYTALYCIHIIVVMAYFVHQQRTTSGQTLNPQFVVALALSAFFGLFTAGMTATSIELTIRNQTSVERLGAETRVHILAVLKPTPGTVPVVNALTGPVPLHYEITYPWGAGSSYTEGIVEGRPRNKVISHTRMADPISVPDINQTASPNLSIPSDAQGLHVLSSGSAPDQQMEESLPPSRDPSDGSTVVAAPESSQSTADRTALETKWPSGEIAARDLRATRTFKILKMLEPGYNPWDLGSSLLNWETVMGTTVLDWFLPLRRSPCCNHDDGESYYLVGPMVDLLRSKYYLLPEAEIRAYGGRRRTERYDPAELASSRSHRENNSEGSQPKSRKRRHRSKQQESPVLDGQPSDVTETDERK